MFSSAMAGEKPALYAPWAVYYSDEAPPDALVPYKLLVLDSSHHPPLAPLTDRGVLVLGYLSLGEVEASRPYHDRVAADGYLVGENKNWQGAKYVDVRDPRWTALVVEELIPAILRQGFQGLFLDTLDSPPYLERDVDRKRFHGMTEAAARLVRTIRYHYPRIPIMMNRAFELLPDVGDRIDMLLAESLRSDYDFDTKHYRMTEEKGYRYNLSLIDSARQRHPGMIIFSLDYWEPADTD
ncbi:MAG: endo alpha-1,4 polygalactosaminidase, partial [Alphaproteobacteria bacterium]